MKQQFIHVLKSKEEASNVKPLIFDNRPANAFAQIKMKLFRDKCFA